MKSALNGVKPKEAPVSQTRGQSLNVAFFGHRCSASRVNLNKFIRRTVLSAPSISKVFLNSRSSLVVDKKLSGRFSQKGDKASSVTTPQRSNGANEVDSALRNAWLTERQIKHKSSVCKMKAYSQYLYIFRLT